MSAMQTLMRAMNPPEKKPNDKAKATSSAIRPPGVETNEVGSHNVIHETPESRAHGKRMLKRPTRSDKAAVMIRPTNPPAFIIARTYVERLSSGDPAPPACSCTESTT